MTVIRPMDSDDIPAVVALGGQMHRNGPYSRYDFDARKVVSQLAIYIHSPRRLALVAADDGTVIGAMLAYLTEYFAGRQVFAMDNGIFIAPERRGDLKTLLGLVARYKSWAREHGAVRVGLGATANYDNAKVGRVFERLGFAHGGALYFMEG